MRLVPASVSTTPSSWRSVHQGALAILESMEVARGRLCACILCRSLGRVDHRLRRHGVNHGALRVVRQDIYVAQGDSFRRPKPSTTSDPDVLLAPSDSILEPPHAGPQGRADFDAFDEAFVRCYPSALQSAMNTLIESLPTVNEGDVLEGQAAFDYMITLRHKMVDAATEAAASYDSVTWLNLIRRLTPHALSFAASGRTDTEGDSTQRVAENLVGTARGEFLDTASMSIPTVVSMKLAKLMALAGMVDSLESGVRSASKGVKYKVRNRRRPVPFDSDALRDALREFDLRSSWSSADDEVRLKEIDQDVFDGDPPMLVAYRFHHGFALDETWGGPYISASPIEEPVQFTIRAFVTGDEKYLVLGRHDVLASFDDPTAAVCLIVFGNALLRHVLAFAEDAGQTLPRLGLMWIANDDLQARVDATLRDPAVLTWLSENKHNTLTAVQVIQRVLDLYQHGRRSFPGPVLQEHAGQTLVDAWAYAWHVTHGLKLSPSGGPIANLSGEAFELVTQELIDASVLAPPVKIRELRGKDLRLNGRSVTDADALLVAGNKLFLISCKRFVTPVAYLAGEHAAARSGTDRLDKALDEWRDRIAKLRENPVGDNYDLSGYEVEGFVLLPELVFTPRKDSRELIRFGRNELFFTRVESYSQFAATLEMASWPTEPAPLWATRVSASTRK